MGGGGGQRSISALILDVSFLWDIKTCGLCQSLTSIHLSLFIQIVILLTQWTHRWCLPSV